MALVLPIAIIGIRHVPLAARVKCYIGFANWRKGHSSVFVAAPESLVGPSRCKPMAALRSLLGGLCCKTILGAGASNIDSRSRVNAQHRFKNSFAPIRLLRISIPQLLRGDFCNTIGGRADISQRLPNNRDLYARARAAGPHLRREAWAAPTRRVIRQARRLAL